MDLRLQVSGQRVRAGLRAWPALDARPLDAVLDMDRASGDGRAWGGATQADLHAWAPLLRVAGVAVDGGRGRAEAWARLRQRRVVDAGTRVALQDVRVRPVAALGIDIDPGTASGVAWDRVEGHARWRTTEHGWQLDVPSLQIERDRDRDGDRAGGARVAVAEGVALAGGTWGHALQAERLDLAPLLDVAALSDRVPPALRDWIDRTGPEGRVRGVRATAGPSALTHAQLQLEAVGFAPVGAAPGVRGLTGVLHADAQGLAFEPDAKAPVTVDWPRGFGTAHAARLSGRIAGWREGEGWRIGTPALRIDGDAVDVDARGSMWFQGDGSRPVLDLAATVAPVELTAAKGFWVRHVMPAAVIDWLDRALVAGRLHDGRALVSGDLDDWPFSAGQGRFEASGRIRDGVLKFQPEWPAADAVDAQVRFVADGFALEGTGALAGIGIRRLQAGIDHYGGGTLTVTAQAASDAARLLTLLRDSPLRRDHGETLDSLRASGPADVGFRLAMPLGSGAATRIAGDVVLRGVRLEDTRWDLAFSDVQGRADYARDGFSAERLAARHDGRPARLSLRAGGQVRQPAHVFEAALEAALGTDVLVARVPELAWLQPHLSGRSRWNAALAVPRTGGTTLRLESDLVGTALALPAPLDKPAGQSLATTVELPLPLAGGDVRVALGRRMALTARTGAAGGTGIRVQLGSDRAPAPAAAGLVAEGRADRLDALGWIALAGGGGSGSGGVSLRGVDVQADRLHLLGGSFANTRLQVADAGAALNVRVDGPALQGTVRVPAAAPGTRGPAITGRFTRLHWRPVAAPGATAAASAQAQGGAAASTVAGARVPASGPSVDPAQETIDPSAIPPLSIDVDDLRVADATLGVTRFRSQPTANGMRIEQLQARSRQQAIELSGDWTGKGAQGRTRLVAGVDSDDIGALLQGLGMGGRVDGGNGNLHLEARWPGSPAAFTLAGLEGRMTLDVRDGRLLEVEPGAGRVLGLLSLAELPRRLTLDFRDFFSKGFAFNRIGGSVAFNDGTARSDDLHIDGPAAAIDIRGSADLRREHFDQTIEVRPKAGNLLAAVGALAGGPVGAAIGAAANAVLSRPLGEIAARTYRVTGPWRDPQVEVVRETTRPVAGQPAPGG